MTDQRIIEGAKLGGRRRFALHGNPLTKEDRVRGGFCATHIRYHAKIFCPRCPLCIERAEGVEGEIGDAE